MTNYKNFLTDLRKLLRKQRVAGFVVPSNDEFQSEFCPEYSRRLKWLTGFTGSFGCAVILENKAAFFTDGRYSTQAKNQVNSKEYEHYNIADKKPWEWVAENIKKKKILLDPWLHTENNVKKYEDVAKISFCKVNPIDILWKERPEAKPEEIKIHPLKYSGKKSSEKITHVINKIKEADACILTAPDSICWLLNIRGNDIPGSPLILTYAIVYKNGRIKLFLDKKRLSESVIKHLGKQVKIVSPDTLRKEIKALNNKKILLDPTVVPHWFFDTLKTTIRGQDPCQLLKACKNKIEIQGAYDAHVIDGAAVTKFLYWLENTKERITELSAAKKILNLRKESREFKGVSFNTIAGFGANSAIIHYKSSEQTNKELKGKGLFLVDSGGQYFSGTTDITRTIAIGTPTKEQKHNYTLVLKGHIALAQAVFPDGTTGSQLDAFARQYLWNEGLDYDHGTGHGVGSYLNVHEGPQRISKILNNTPLKPGMIISNEPGYYKEDKYGIRIENLFVVVDKPGLSGFYAFDILTKAPIDMNLIDNSMLSEEERNWLLSYHCKVFEDILPFLDKEIREWLRKFL